MSCSRCCRTSDLSVWVVSDPYYGYGHYPTLRCEGCSRPNDWRYDSHHEYVPYYDDSFLGLTKKGPLVLSSMHIPDNEHWKEYRENLFCYDCKEKIEKEDSGWYKALEYYVENNRVYVCKPCALERYDNNTHSSESFLNEINAS